MIYLYNGHSAKIGNFLSDSAEEELIESGVFYAKKQERIISALKDENMKQTLQIKGLTEDLNQKENQLEVCL